MDPYSQKKGESGGSRSYSGKMRQRGEGQHKLLIRGAV